MNSGIRLLLLWVAVVLLWVLPVVFLASKAMFFPLWPALLYLSVVVAVSVFVLARTVQWLRRRS